MIAQSVHDDSADLSIEKKVFETLPLKWTKGYNLSLEQEVLIPFNWFFMINEFNGPSAGNCVEEAISQGICEIVERHVSSLISHGKINVPGIIPESAKDPMVVAMLKKYEQAGVKLRLSDFSLDIGIPTVGVMAWDPKTFPSKSEIIWTAGTTPDPEKALSRALTETAQLAGDFNTGSNYVASGLPKFRDLSEGDFIMNPGKMVPIASLPDLSHGNIRVEVQNLVAALNKRRMEVFIINTQHPGLQIPAFYTIIPGAHFRERSLGTSVGMFSAKMITETFPPAQAIKRLLEFDQMLPGKYYVRFYLGTLFLAMDDPETALGHFEAALDLNPKEQDRASIYSYMGVCLKEMERYEEAMVVLEKGAALDNERTDIHNLMGFIHFKSKRHHEAIASFEKVIRLDPSSAIDYANIGSNYRDLGNREKAIEYYLMALEIDPEITFARENLIRLQGDIDFK
jgi:ribosomal protein S12 methylthiotransferase accessory factor